MATPPIQPPLPPPSNGKPGVRTTEFYVSIIAAIAAILAQVSGLVPEPWGAICAAVSVAAYTISRGLAKSGTLTGPS